MTPADVRRYEQLLRYKLAILDAEERLLDFARFTMPDPKRLHDPARSKFIDARHFNVMADLLEAIERGEVLKAILNFPVRHGKTTVATHAMTAWFTGRNPDKEVMVATYGEKFARQHRAKVAEILGSHRFKQVFPDYSVATEGGYEIVNHLGKRLHFLGRRSEVTGKGFDLGLIDDPVKDDREVRFQLYRDDIWEWLTQTLLTRPHTDKAPWLMTCSRWHEDDPAGRLMDKSNPKYSARLADGLVVVNLPALAEDDDLLGRKPGEPLWPERFGEAYLLQRQEVNPVAFSALYQGDPTPGEGIFYLQEDLHTYTHDELPEAMRYFGASDHAVSMDAVADPSCMGIFGICPQGNAYVLPDLVWRKLPSVDAVEEMIRLMRKWKPLWWYAERGHISRAIGPFLKKRMQEEMVHVPILEDQPVADKMQRAQSARSRCAQGRILFPSYAAWWPKAKAELLKFPNGRHDDFVDFLSIIGMKLETHVAGRAAEKKSAPKPGTWGYLKAEFAEQDRAQSARGVRAGW